MSPNTGTDARLVDRIDALLPQTQCTRCGYPDCRSYAQALAARETRANRCPPGGQAGADALAELLHEAPQALDPECGEEGPRLLARIETEHCIGCTKCIIACPVDAIIGAPKYMHHVLPTLCSGCELCVPPCPVDCIRIEPAGIAWTDADARAARTRHDARAVRLARLREDNDVRHLEQADDKLAGVEAEIARVPAPGTTADEKIELQRRKAVIEAAMARARARQASRKTPGG